MWSNDIPETGVLGLAVVSTESRHAESLLDRSISFLETSRPDVEISRVESETIFGF